jgi:ABC-type methionine transport system ATPase subunit
MRVHLTFPEKLIKEPVIYNLGKRFDIVTNIRRANVEEKIGWVVLEMEADQKSLEQGIKYMEELGVTVNPLEGDIFES